MRQIFLVSLLAAAACNKGVDFAGNSADKVNPVVVIDQEYPAAVVDDQSVKYMPAFGLVEEDLTLHEQAPVASTFNQTERPVAVDEYKQGREGDLSQEEFDISTAGKLDLILVVDDSASMGDEHGALATNLQALTKHLKSIDWQIGIVTTSVMDKNNRVQPCTLQNSRAAGMPIKKTDLDPEADFFKTINDLGTKGSGSEQGIKQAMRVLNDNCGATWLRQDAAWGVMFISDEESYCSRTTCPDKDSAKDIVDLMNAKHAADKLKAYALIWDDKAADATDAAKCVAAHLNGETKGQRYADVVAAIGGVVGSVCVDTDPNTNDYDVILDRVSKDVARIVKRDFALKYKPANATIDATVDGQPFVDFVMDGKTIKLNSVSGDSVKLKVSYRYDAKEKFDHFEVKDKAAAETVKVYVNNQELAPAKFSFDDATSEVHLVDMPADDADIKIKYRKSGTLPTALDIESAAMDGLPISIQIDGKAVDSEFDAATRVLTFKEAPADGAEIKVWHRVKGGKTLRYAATAADTLAGLKNVSAKDAKSGSVVDVKLDGTELVLGDADVQDGRDLVVTFDYGDAQSVLSHELPNEPLDGTLDVKTAAGVAGCIDHVTVDGRKVSFVCDGDKLGEVVITYKYVAQRFDTFEVTDVIPADGFVQVYVDGQAVFDFTRDGQTIGIPQDLLELDSKVRIIVTSNH